jgi:hypothetical protein
MRAEVNRSIFLLLLILLLGWGSWSYIYGVLDPFWRAQRAGSVGGAYHSDFYARWLGTRLTLVHHANPYSESVTKEIQEGIYGHPLDPASKMDPHAFAYPAYVMVLIAPFTIFPFEIAGTVFSVILFLMALSLGPLLMFGLGQNWSPRSRWITVVALFASFPLVEALYVQQFVILVMFTIAAGLALLLKKRLVSAGIMFAFSTIKPQLSVLMLAWLFLWSVARWRTRSRLLFSFLATMLLLVLSAELLVPGWFKGWLGSISAFLRYPDMKAPAEWLLPPTLARAITLGVLVSMFVVLWRLRDSEPGEGNFTFASALALATTLVIVPTWPALQYNQILLVPAALVLARMCTQEIAAPRRVLSFFTLGVFAFSSVGALFVSVATLVFKVPVAQLGNGAELPLVNFAVAPFGAVAVMTYIYWTAICAQLGGGMTPAPN